MATYNRASPYYNTKQNNLYLELITIRPVPAEADDFLYTIETQYKNRPDLLAYDLYQDSKLWWVFSVRNKSIIKDPIFDLKAGIKIYLPKQTTLKKVLGI